MMLWCRTTHKHWHTNHPSDTFPWQKVGSKEKGNFWKVTFMQSDLPHTHINLINNSIGYSTKQNNISQEILLTSQTCHISEYKFNT